MNSPPPLQETLRSYAQALGLPLWEADLPALAQMLTQHLAEFERITRLDLREVEPFETFDPTWTSHRLT